MAEKEWHELTVSFNLRDARIVATLDEDGGAIVENLPKLECSEGRRRAYQSRGLGEPLLPLLEYSLDFFIPDVKPPDAAEASRARIVISGQHDNNLRVEIRGFGWIGYDDQGRVGGRFDMPPAILTDDDEVDEAPSQQDRPSGDVINLRDRVPMPTQYVQACTRVDDDDFSL